MSRVISKQRHLKTIRNRAFYQEQGQVPKNAIDELANHQKLSEKGLKQLDHAIDLAKFSIDDSIKRLEVESLRDHIQSRLAQNDFVRHLDETGQSVGDQTFTYQGETFNKVNGVPLMRQEHDTFTRKDRFMTRGEIQKLATRMLTPLDHTLDGAVSTKIKKINRVNTLSPQDAYNLIQKGKYSTHVRNQHISQFYTWKDVMIGNSITNQNIKNIPLNVYKNAEKHAKVLDRIAQDVGQKIDIESWIRIKPPGSRGGSYHYSGLATDYHGSKTLLHGPVYNAARRIEGLGIGKSDGQAPGFVGLHIDSPGIFFPDDHRPSKKGYQFEFIDNGAHPSTGTGFHSQKILP